jgi:hypothetical protein
MHKDPQGGIVVGFCECCRCQGNSIVFSHDQSPSAEVHHCHFGDCRLDSTYDNNQNPDPGIVIVRGTGTIEDCTFTGGDTTGAISLVVGNDAQHVYPLTVINCLADQLQAPPWTDQAYWMPIWDAGYNPIGQQGLTAVPLRAMRMDQCPTISASATVSGSPTPTPSPVPSLTLSPVKTDTPSATLGRAIVLVRAKSHDNDSHGKL